MIFEAIETSFDKLAQTRMATPAQKVQVVESIMQMFTNLRKQPVPDLEKRTENMRRRVERAVEGMTLEFVRGELVVKVTGSSEQLLTEFRRGSDWFAPEPEVDNIILAAMLVDPTRS